jgi:hypothetical protein
MAKQVYLGKSLKKDMKLALSSFCLNTGTKNTRK